MNLAQAERILETERQAHAGVFYQLADWPGWDICIRHQGRDGIIKCNVALLAPPGTEPEYRPTGWYPSLDEALEEAGRHLGRHREDGTPEAIRLDKDALVWDAAARIAVLPETWEAACGVVMAHAVSE